MARTALRLASGPLWRQALAAGLLAACLFAAISAVAFWLYPTAADKLFFLTPLTPMRLIVTGAYWDTRHYANLVLLPQCVAFYPLWPSLIRLLFAPNSTIEATTDLVRSTWVLALVGLPLVYAAARRISGSGPAALAVLCLYAVNPYALFRVIGYTEAIFAIETAVLVLVLQRWQDGRRGWLTLTGVALATGLVALTRPMVPQIVVATLGAWVAVSLVRATFRAKPGETGLLAALATDKGLLRLVALMALAAVAGYAVYGVYCLNTVGDFLRPFTEQKHWGKKPGLYLSNLVWSYMGHNEFMGLYFPVLLLLVALWRLGQSRPAKGPGRWRTLPVWLSMPLAIAPSIWMGAHALYLGHQVWRPAARGPAALPQPVPHWADSFPFWFCLFIAGAHSGLILLTDPNLLSLARFIFGQPWFFLALACLAPMVPKAWRWFAFGLPFTGSALLLIGLWRLFSQDAWMG